METWREDGFALHLKGKIKGTELDISDWKNILFLQI